MMNHFLQSMKLALLDSYHYLNELRFKFWLPFFLALFFLGWNGLQIIFSLNLVFSFIDTRSITGLVYTTLEYHLRSVPIYLFIVITFIIIHWLLHCIFEAGFTNVIHKRKNIFNRMYAAGVNFFIPNLIIVLTIFFIFSAFFTLSIFFQIMFTGYSPTVVNGLETAVYRILALSVFLSVVVTMWLVDFVLPRMTMGESFKHAFMRSAIILNRKPFTLISFYLIKLLLILFTIYLFQIVLRHFVLPLFIMLEAKFSFGVFLLSGRTLIIEKLFTNIWIMLVIFFSALLIFSPLMAPFYVFQRFLLFRLTKV